jgi:ATP-dependent RNA helicase DDX49/DBP8
MAKLTTFEGMDDDISLFSSRKRVKLTSAGGDHGHCPPSQRTNADAIDEPQDQPAIKPAHDDLEDFGEEASFNDLGLSEWLQKVCRSLGMSHPTPVQRACIPAVLQGKDVIGVAHTGSGKTAAFALPIIQKLAKDPYGVFALVLTPTRWAFVRDGSVQSLHAQAAFHRRTITAYCRELAFQLADQFKALGAGLSLKEAVVVGGLDMQQQSKELARRPHIVIATPGRLKVCRVSLSPSAREIQR